MNQLDLVAQTIALTMGVAWASGINLYAAIFMLGCLGALGETTLPANLEILTHPAVLIASGLMFIVEFFADKIPGVDSGWDAVHTFIRIPAGAALAAGAIGSVNPGIVLAAAIVGGTVSASTHAAKAGSRILINTSPEPVTNWLASLSEDVIVIGGLWTALHYPWLFLVFLIAFGFFLSWLLPKVFSGLKSLFGYISRLFGGKKIAAENKEHTPEQEPIAGGQKQTSG